MNMEELTGRTITNIFVTRRSSSLEGIPGTASFFCIVLEINNTNLYEIGAHEIFPWVKEDELIPYKKTAWQVENDLDVVGKKIARVIKRDANEYYDGSLTLVMDNNVSVEHQVTNGDQLFIDMFKG